MRNLIGNVLLVLLFPFFTFAQNLEELHILIVLDNDEQDQQLVQFQNNVKEEINALLANRREVSFESRFSAGNSTQLNQYFTEGFNDSKTDIIIGIGPLSSAILAQQPSFPKPTIAGLIIDNELQNVSMTAEGTSGINNFTYIQSPFSFEKDLQVLYDIYPFKNVGIISPADVAGLFPNFTNLFRKSAESLNTDFTAIPVSENATSIVDLLPEDVDAVYVFPLFDEVSNAGYASLFQGLAEKEIPSVALLGEAMVAQGAMVGYESASNLAKMPRRIALDVAKIAKGQNASTLPVEINTFSESLVINMNTVRKVGTYPSWDLMTEAIVLNDVSPDTDLTLSLQSVIMEALKRNLSLKVAAQNPLLASQEVKLAQTELLPQLDVNTSLVLLDQTTAENAFGTKGRLNWMAGSSLSQLIYAEPALANIAIQKLLQKGEEAGLSATQLDVVLDAANAYLSVLQAKKFMEIQASNVNVTKSNLDISKAKDAVGYSGATDLNRWKTELAIGKIDLNDAQVQYRQAKYALNQFLNHPINEDFTAEDIDNSSELLMVTDERLITKINNERDLNKLANFMVKEALARLPELQQIDYGLAAQQRLLKSQKRAFYLPSVAFSGGLDYTLQRWDIPDAFPTPPDLEPAWNLGIGASYNILEGGRKRVNQQTTEVNILQIKDQRADAKNQLELRVRAALQTAGASFFRVQRYEEAKIASTENFQIVQDSYSQGLTSVTNLVDAQNAKVQTELGLANAKYQFILDFLEVERAVGFYYQLATKVEQDGFFQRLDGFLIKD